MIHCTCICFRPLLCFYSHKLWHYELKPSLVCCTVSEERTSSYLCAYSIRISYLQASIKGPLNGHTLAGVGTVGSDGCDEGVELILLLFQFLHQALDGSFCKCLALATLSVAHQAVDDA